MMIMIVLSIMMMRRRGTVVGDIIIMVMMVCQHLENTFVFYHDEYDNNENDVDEEEDAGVEVVTGVIGDYNHGVGNDEDDDIIF